MIKNFLILKTYKLDQASDYTFFYLEIYHGSIELDLS